MGNRAGHVSAGLPACLGTGTLIIISSGLAAFGQRFLSLAVRVSFKEEQGGIVLRDLGLGARRQR